MSRTRRALSLAAMLLWATAAHAAIALRQVSPPATYNLPGRAVDVLGIVPGMSPTAVRDILSKRYGDVQTFQDNLGLEERGAAVSTAPFLTRMTAGTRSDQVTVWFATPTTGNGVVEVSRQLIYADPAKAPELRQVQAELVAKYGPPADAPSSPNAEVAVFTWAYGNGKPAPCPQGSCRAEVSEGLNMANIAVYERAARNGHPLLIVASLLSAIDRPERASSVSLTVSDAATKARTLDAAVAQMREAVGGARAAKVSAQARKHD